MNRRLVIASLISVMISLSIGLVQAQVDVQKDLSDEQLWTDAIYFLKIGRAEYGQAYLKAYLDRKVDPVNTLVFSEKDPRSVQILTKLSLDPKLGEMARSALDQIDQGWQIRRQDVPRISAEIERLGGTARAQFQATERLKETGEYAAPVMLEYLANEKFAGLQAKIVDAFVAMGPSAVEPLLAALPNLDKDSKTLVIGALGRLDYAQSLPYLKAIVAGEKTLPTVKTAAQQAIESILSRNPRYRSEADASEAFYQLALRYYYQDTAVKPVGQSREAGLVGDVSADQPNIWQWKEGKLVPQPTPWELYYDLMTMRLTRKSLDLDSKTGQRGALTLWLMSNCRRDSKLSATVKDPLHAADFPSVDYFYRSAGTQYSLDSLSRALKDGDLVVVTASLKALREVASTNNVLATAGNAQPIVEALNHPNQVVRINAALALGWAAPCETYPGVGEVVPLLGQTIAGIKNPSAMLIVADEARRTSMAKTAQTMGFAVIEAKDFDAAAKGLEKSAAEMELIVLDYGMTNPTASQAVQKIRQNPLLRLVPVMVLTSQDKLADAKTTLGDQTGVAIVVEGTDAKTIAAQADALKKKLGRVTLGQAEQDKNALLAAQALERLAKSGSKQYNVEEARDALAGAMNNADWTLGLQSAKVLSLLGSKEAQQILADAAVGRKNPAQKVELLTLLGESVRSFCNQLTAKQVETLQQMVITEADSAIREATAKVVGTLNLEPKVARNIILARDPFGAMK
jgi:CheY-like chemotaxis protein